MKKGQALAVRAQRTTKGLVATRIASLRTRGEDDAGSDKDGTGKDGTGKDGTGTDPGVDPNEPVFDDDDPAAEDESRGEDPAGDEYPSDPGDPPGN